MDLTKWPSSSARFGVMLLCSFSWRDAVRGPRRAARGGLKLQGTYTPAKCTLCLPQELRRHFVKKGGVRERIDWSVAVKGWRSGC
ncbi:hypothetical protein DOTSEDRAFT_69612 [Dothistroma septosporum NZE10]|uniref:Uncharacterized protein n=1 Tax=Dothistroma septosporum (strain NZE10 / CBS 128990) TaxID=675120 RepID=N1PZT4_DOTSN|nr:hypothetical protein DOTSEDRAFT_69612 [Dothistroma septosporum NZE10]